MQRIGRSSRSSGFLLVDKPEGLSSRKVVDVIQGEAGYRGKIGHSGTLDPMATGLLVLCLGKATRLASYLIRDDKSYLGTIELGKETDTGDIEGRVVFQGGDALTGLDSESIREAFEPFRGVFFQVPPDFSARKVGGKRAYELARKGEPIELKASEVEIKELEILKIELPSVHFYVKCSSGTYIRSLALDVGRLLGTGAHLTSLRRLEVGPFNVGEAEKLEKLKEECRQGNLEKWLFPMNTVLGSLSKVIVNTDGERLLRQGSPLSQKEFSIVGVEDHPLHAGKEVQVWSDSSNFLAVGRVSLAERGKLVLYPSKVFG
jgi:tRNA pseudouridine55 synthase